MRLSLALLASLGVGAAVPVVVARLLRRVLADYAEPSALSVDLSVLGGSITVANLRLTAQTVAMLNGFMPGALDVAVVEVDLVKITLGRSPSVEVQGVRVDLCGGSEARWDAEEARAWVRASVLRAADAASTLLGEHGHRLQPQGAGVAPHAAGPDAAAGAVNRVIDRLLDNLRVRLAQLRFRFLPSQGRPAVELSLAELSLRTVGTSAAVDGPVREAERVGATTHDTWVVRELCLSQLALSVGGQPVLEPTCPVVRLALPSLMATLLSPFPHDSKRLRASLSVPYLALALHEDRLAGLFALLEPFVAFNDWFAATTTTATATATATTSSAAGAGAGASQADLDWYAANLENKQEAERRTRVECTATLPQLLGARRQALAWKVPANVELDRAAELLAAALEKELRVLHSMEFEVTIDALRIDVDRVLTLGLDGARVGAGLDDGPMRLSVRTRRLFVGDGLLELPNVALDLVGMELTAALAGLRVDAQLAPLFDAISALQRIAAAIPASTLPPPPPAPVVPEETMMMLLGGMELAVRLTLRDAEIFLPPGVTLSLAATVDLASGASGETLSLDVHHLALAPLLAPTDLSLRYSCMSEEVSLSASLSAVTVSVSRAGLTTVLDALTQVMLPLQQTQEELAAAAAQHEAARREARRAEVRARNAALVVSFERVDADGNGVLTTVEVAELLRGEGADLALSQAERDQHAAEFVAKCDTDGDGTVSLAEFQRELSKKHSHAGRLALRCGEYVATPPPQCDWGKPQVEALLETWALPAVVLQQKLVRATRNYAFAEATWKRHFPATPWVLTRQSDSGNAPDLRIRPWVKTAVAASASTPAPTATATTASAIINLHVESVAVYVLDDVLPRSLPRLSLLVDELSADCSVEYAMPGYDVNKLKGSLRLRLDASVYNSVVRAQEPVIERWTVRGTCGPGAEASVRASYLSVNVTETLLESLLAVVDVLTVQHEGGGEGMTVVNRTGAEVVLNDGQALRHARCAPFVGAALTVGDISIRPDLTGSTHAYDDGRLIVDIGVRPGRGLVCTLRSRITVLNPGVDPLTVCVHPARVLAADAQRDFARVHTLGGGHRYHVPSADAEEGLLLSVWHPLLRRWSRSAPLGGLLSRTVPVVHAGHCALTASSAAVDGADGGWTLLVDDWTIMVAPRAALRNALPFPVLFSAVAVRAGGDPGASVGVEGSIEAGFSGAVTADSLFEEEDGHAVEIFVRLKLPNGLGWTEMFCVQGAKPDAEVALQDHQQLRLAVMTEDSHACVYAPVWLQNRTGLLLEYEAVDTHETAASSADQEITLLSQNTSKIRVRAVGFRQREGAVLEYWQAKHRPTWSEPFPLAGSTGEIVMGTAALGVSLESLPLDGTSATITLVVFTPRYVLQNRLQRTVALRPLLGHPSSKERARAQIVSLHGGEACSMHSFTGSAAGGATDTGERLERFVAVRPSSSQLHTLHEMALSSTFSDDESSSSSSDVEDGEETPPPLVGRAAKAKAKEGEDDDDDDDESTDRSAARVCLDHVGESFFWLNGTLAKATVELQQATLLVALSDAEGSPPYRIENRALSTGIWVRQAGTRRARRLCVPGGTWADFAWTEHSPSSLQTVEVGLMTSSAPFGKFSLDEASDLGAKMLSSDVKLALKVEIQNGATRTLVVSDFSTPLPEPPGAESVEAVVSSLFLRANVDVQLDGLGVALVQARPAELLNLTIDAVRLCSGAGARDIVLSVFHVQLDDMRPRSRYPVVLQPMNSGLHTGRRRPVPAAAVPLLQVRVEVGTSSSELEWCELMLQPLQVALDIDYLMLVLDFVWKLWPESPEDLASTRRRDVAAVRTLLPKLTEPLPDPSSVVVLAPGSSSCVYMRLLHLHALRIELELVMQQQPLDARSMARWGPLLSLLATLGTSFAHVSPTFNFRELVIQHAFAPYGALVWQVLSNYIKQALPQLYKVFGSVEMLGDPVGLVDDLGTGVIEFFRTTASELTGEADTKGEGVRLLLTAVVGSSFGSVSKITGSVSSLVQGITGVEGSEWHDDDGPDHVGEGVMQGGQVLAQSLTDGISGLWLKPMEGARAGGVAGFATGMVRGVVGVAAAPVVGVLGATTKLAQSVEATTHLLLHGGRDVGGRRRSPRPFLLGPRLRSLQDMPVLKSLRVRLRRVRGLPATSGTGSPRRLQPYAVIDVRRDAQEAASEDEVHTETARAMAWRDAVADFPLSDVADPTMALRVSVLNKEVMWRDSEMGHLHMDLSQVVRTFGMLPLGAAAAAAEEEEGEERDGQWLPLEESVGGAGEIELTVQPFACSLFEELIAKINGCQPPRPAAVVLISLAHD